MKSHKNKEENEAEKSKYYTVIHNYFINSKQVVVKNSRYYEQGEDRQMWPEEIN